MVDVQTKLSSKSEQISCSEKRWKTNLQKQIPTETENEKKKYQMHSVSWELHSNWNKDIYTIYIQWLLYRMPSRTIFIRVSAPITIATQFQLFEISYINLVYKRLTEMFLCALANAWICANKQTYQLTLRKFVWISIHKRFYLPKSSSSSDFLWMITTFICLFFFIFHKNLYFAMEFIA